MKLLSQVASVNPFYLKWWAKMDSLFCGKATPVATVHWTVAKSRLSSPSSEPLPYLSASVLYVLTIS